MPVFRKTNCHGTGTEIELNEAKEVVRNAEIFVRAVERVFGLDKPSLASEYENPTSKDDEMVSELAIGVLAFNIIVPI